MNPGPKPQPLEEKRRRGNPGKRRLPVALSVALPADPNAQPDHLGPSGAWMWGFVTQHAAPWLSQSDTATLRLLCEAMDRRGDLMAALSEQGYVLYTDKNYAYQNPAVGALIATEKQITAWMSSLGLNTADRGNLGLAEVKVRSKLEELRTKAGRPASSRPSRVARVAG